MKTEPELKEDVCFWRSQLDEVTRIHSLLVKLHQNMGKDYHSTMCLNDIEERIKYDLTKSRIALCQVRGE